MLRLPSAVLEFVLLPVLTDFEELALCHAIRTTKHINAVDGALSAESVASHATSFTPLSSSLLKCFLSEKFLLHRVTLRLTATLQYFAAKDTAFLESLDIEQVNDECSTSCVVRPQFIQSALKGLILATKMNLDEALQQFQQSYCYPIEWAIVDFFEGYVVSRHTREEVTLDESEQVVPFIDGTLQRLPCSLNIRVQTLKQLRAFIAGGGEGGGGTNSSSTSPSSSLSPEPESSLQPLTVPSLPCLSVAIQRLLSLLSRMRADGCVWIHCLSSPSGFNTQHQIHPFLLRWPTTRIEWIEIMQTYFPDFAASLDIVITESTNTNLCCDGMCNPDAALSDEKLFEAMGGSVDPDTDEYLPPDEDHQTANRSWQCTLNCPESHQGKPFGDLICPHHLQTVRGCLWWNCFKGEYGVRQLLARMIGLKPKYAKHLVTRFPRPGLRTDWSPFFARAPPFVQFPPDVSTKPISREVQSQLTATFPWSLAGTIALEEPDCIPAPAFLAAPLAPGWVGGFIGATNRSSH